MMTVDTSVEIKKNPRKVSVISGSETIPSIEFEFEIFNCRFQIQFIKEFIVQLGESTNAKNVIKQIDRKECEAITQYTMTNPFEGVTVDPTTGLMVMDTSKEMTMKYVMLELVVGSQTLPYSSDIAVEVFDCISKLKFTQSQSIQMGSDDQKFMGATDEHENTIHSHRAKDCKGYYSLENTDGTQPIEGLKMNNDNSEITVVASQKIAPQTLVVRAKLGIQTKLSEPFTIEVFSCEDGLTHQPNIQAQIGSLNDAGQFDLQLLKTKPTNPGCPTDIKYSVKGLTEGVTFVSEGENIGQIKIDTSKTIDTTVKYTATIGKQQFSNDLKVQIFDCLPDLEFIKYYQATQGSETTVIDLLSKNNNEGLCAIQSFTSSNLPEGVTLDSATGKLTFPTDQLLNANLKFDATAGL